MLTGGDNLGTNHTHLVHKENGYLIAMATAKMEKREKHLCILFAPKISKLSAKLLSYLRIDRVTKPLSH